jgi:hypothetical protein
MDELLRIWTQTYDEMMRQGKEHRNLIARYEEDLAGFRDSLAELEAPYREKLDEIAAEIRPMAEAHGKTYKGETAEVKYRKGAVRVTYDWRRVDSVRDFLRDVLPETAASLSAARAETVGESTVTIARL